MRITDIQPVGQRFDNLLETAAHDHVITAKLLVHIPVFYSKLVKIGGIFNLNLA